MHHPQPHHPPSTQRYFRADFADSCSSYRTTTSNVRSSKPLPSDEGHRVPEPVDPPYQVMSVHPPVPPSTEHRTPETYHGFQLPASRYQVGSPTFALRPVTAPFSHIEYPSMPTERTQPSDSHGPKPQDSIATAYNHMQTRDQSYSFQQPAYELNGMGPREPELHDHQALGPQSYRGSSERSQDTYAYSHADQQMNRMNTVKPAMRRRIRGDSSSSVASVWSSVAVSGDLAYRNDGLHDDANTGGRYRSRSGSIQLGDKFQPQSVVATYPYEYAPMSHEGMLAGTIGAVAHSAFPASPAMDVDSSYILPPASRPNELELRDPEHPFVSGRADWNGAMSAASTDGDAASLHSQDQLSSRGSSEPSSGPTRRNKQKAGAKANSPATSERGEASREGRKKSVMACHFCRFRKLRCDGGHPCGHCNHRGKECTYDAAVRRRGPGRKNKSAQETARVQLANRQREEAARESVIQKPAVKERPVREKASRDKVPKDDSAFRNAWSQKSPRLHNQLPAALPRSDLSVYSLDTEFHHQPRTSHDSPVHGQEYSAFPAPFGYARERESEVSRPPHEWMEQETLPISLAHQQRGEEHRRIASGPLSHGLQTPISQGPSGYYDGSSDRYPQQSQYASSVHGYAPYRYSIATQGGESNYSHTDTESAYAYSEGANVLPYGYEQQQFESRQQQRSGMQPHFRRMTGVPQYPSEATAESSRMANAFDGRADMEKNGVRR